MMKPFNRAFFYASCFLQFQDLKPNNLLYTIDGKMKLADFGLARSYGSPGRHMTPTVVTRWYRPPELCFGCREYGDAVDMWGVSRPRVSLGKHMSLSTIFKY